VLAELNRTPLEVALNTDFQTLVELLARHEQSQELKNRALRHAISLKRLDFIELLVSCGDQLRSVPFVKVLRVWHPVIIRYFSLRQKNPRSLRRGGRWDGGGNLLRRKRYTNL
jgi:hypothetical protein